MTRAARAQAQAAAEGVATGAYRRTSYDQCQANELNSSAPPTLVRRQPLRTGTGKAVPILQESSTVRAQGVVHGP